MPRKGIPRARQKREEERIGRKDNDRSQAYLADLRRKNQEMENLSLEALRQAEQQRIDETNRAMRAQIERAERQAERERIAREQNLRRQQEDQRRLEAQQRHEQQMRDRDRRR